MSRTANARRRLRSTATATLTILIPQRRFARTVALFVVVVVSLVAGLTIAALADPSNHHVRVVERRIWSAEAFAPPERRGWERGKKIQKRKSPTAKAFGEGFVVSDATRIVTRTGVLPNGKSEERTATIPPNKEKINHNNKKFSPKKTVWIAKRSPTLATAALVASLVLSVPAQESAAIASAAATERIFPPQTLLSRIALSPSPPSSSYSVSSFQTPTLVLSTQPPYPTTTGPLVDTTDAVLTKLDSGVTYRDLREGTGEATATEGKRVNIQWVLKRSNGYSIDSSSQHDGVPFIFVVGATSGVRGNGQQQQSPPRAIPGLDEGIRGMRVGGIRRIVIPPSLAYVGNLDDPSAPGPVPPGFGPKQRIRRVMENRADVPDESFLLDVKLTRVQ